ncbi:MAG: BamA/TamA family outer membrane protein [Candidatus Eisenbacteria bacterium]
MRRWNGASLALAACVAIASSWSPPSAAAAARLDYRGSVLSASQAQTLAGGWLRAPGDSAAAAAALGRIVARLQELGYLDARASGQRDSMNGDRLLLRVEEGRRYRLAEVRVQAGSSADSAAVRRALRLVAGNAASPRAVHEALDAAVRRLSDEAHPYAEIAVAGWTTDSAGVRVSLAAELGPPVTIERVRFEGLKVTQPAFARRAMGRLIGLPYRRASAEAARDRLSQLGLFRSVRYEGLEAGAVPTLGQLVYRVEEPRFNRFEGAVGVQGDAGTVGLARLDLGNLLGTGRALGLHWEARGKGIADFLARYREPLVFGLPLAAEGMVAQQVQDTLFTRTRWGARAGFALSNQERIEVGFEGERVVQSAGSLEQAWLQHTVFALERSTLDSPLAPRKGSRARVSADQIFKRERLRPAATRTARASAVQGRVEVHRPLGTTTGLALELALAGRFSSQRVLPLFERYPLGGTATLRGFDEEAFRVDRYALSRTEWRVFLGGGGQRIALFWDHAFTQTRLSLPAGGDRLELAHRNGLGFGLRVEAAGGLIGVDYGLEPGRGAFAGKIHLQLISTF